MAPQQGLPREAQVVVGVRAVRGDVADALQALGVPHRVDHVHRLQAGGGGAPDHGRPTRRFACSVISDSPFSRSKGTQGPRKRRRAPGS